MPTLLRATRLLAVVVSLALCANAPGATSAENNPFALTLDQVNARFLRIQQEVDRLRAAGLNSAADLMGQRLQHFRDELAGRAPSLIGGPELDSVSMYTADTGNPVVNVYPTDRPVVLALGSYDSANWTLQLHPGARLERIILSAYDGVAGLVNPPPNVPVQTYSELNGASNRFYFYSKTDASYAQSAQTLYRLTGLPPSSMQLSYRYSGTPFSIGTANSEWAAQRVLNEMQPLYKEATAFQLAQDRAAADQHRFTGLYTTYSPSGSAQGTRVAEMTPLRAIDGTILPAFVNYRYIAVDPRGPTYYGFSSSSVGPVKFDPVTRQETRLPTLASDVLGSVSGMTFDTERNRLVLSNSTGGPSGGGFLFYYSDEAMWFRSAVVNHHNNRPSTLTYSAVDDAYYGLDDGALGALSVLRFDPTGLFTRRIELSQFITCGGYDPCQLVATGDRLALIVPPAADLYEPLLPPLPHSYLIDPASGNVTILGALPEPQGMLVLAGMVVVLMRQRRRCRN